MNNKEGAAVQRLIDTPITAENINEPVVAFFPEKSCEHQHLKWADGKELEQECLDCGMVTGSAAAEESQPAQHGCWKLRIAMTQRS